MYDHDLWPVREIKSGRTLILPLLSKIYKPHIRFVKECNVLLFALVSAIKLAIFRKLPKKICGRKGWFSTLFISIKSINFAVPK